MQGRALLLGVFFLSVCACSRQSPPAAPPGHPRPYNVHGNWYQPIPTADGFQQRGIASWYGPKFHGRRTASGEIYNMHAMTAAHKTLPLGTVVRVTDISSDHSVVVKINDRGPFVHGRIVDLSYAAAKQMKIVGQGTAEVELVALGAERNSRESAGTGYAPLDYDKGNFTFQVGAFKNRQNAERLMQRLAKTDPNAHVRKYESPDGTFYRVRVGKYTSLRQIERDEKRMIERGYTDAFIVAE